MAGNDALRQARAMWPDVEGFGCTRPKVGAAWDETGTPLLVNFSRGTALQGWTALYEQNPEEALTLLRQAGAQLELRSLRAVLGR